MPNFALGPLDPPAILSDLIIFYGVGSLIWTVVMLFVCALLQHFYRLVPERYRALKPGSVWFLLIPVFSILWSFWVYPRLSRSFKAYFDSVGDTSVGDCYGRVAFWYCVAWALSFIPILLLIAGPASLILHIIYLLSIYQLTRKMKPAP